MLALGADKLVMGQHAELGPLDAQAHSPELGRRRSVLDEVQTLERLNAFALRSLDETMELLLGRTQMRVDRLLPEAMAFVDSLVRPLMEGIDTSRWTEMSRLLKVGEDYAIRLLKNKYPSRQAEQIARDFVERYTEHGFAIDRDEVQSHGLEVEKFDPVIEAIFERLMPFVDNVTAIGMMVEK